MRYNLKFRKLTLYGLTRPQSIRKSKQISGQTILSSRKTSSSTKRGNFIYPMMHGFLLYYQASLPNACDPISSTGTRQLNSGGKRLVLPIKPSVPLLCRSIYDFRFTIPNISLVKSKRVFGPPIIS